MGCSLSNNINDTSKLVCKKCTFVTHVFSNVPPQKMQKGNLRPALLYHNEEQTGFYLELSLGVEGVLFGGTSGVKLVASCSMLTTL